MRKILTVLVLVLAASCGSDDGGADEASSSTTAEDTTTSTGAESTTTTEAAAEPDGPIVVLEPGGLGVVTDSESGSTVQLTFGDATQEDTVTALTAALGEPTEERNLNDCGEGPLHSVRFPSVAVYFADEVFEGWHLQPTGPIVLTTANGIGIGSTRADLEEAFADVAVQETSLGLEFIVGTEPGPYLSGTLVDDAPDGEIDAMWSGMICVAR